MIGCREMTKKEDEQPEVQPTEVKPKKKSQTLRAQKAEAQVEFQKKMPACWAPTSTS